MDEIPVGNIPMAWVAPILNTRGYMDMDTSRVWVQMNSNVPKDIPMLLPTGAGLAHSTRAAHGSRQTHWSADHLPDGRG